MERQQSNRCCRHRAGGRRQLVDQPAGVYAEALIERVHGAIAAVLAMFHAGPDGLFFFLPSFRHSRPHHLVESQLLPD